MTENSRDVQLRASMDATGVKAGVEQAKSALGDLAKTAEREGAKAGAGLERAGEGAEKAGQKIDRETRSMIGSIERATAAFKAGQKGGADYFEALAKQRGVSGDALKPYLEQLRQAEAAQKAAQGSLNGMGASAAQTAAALRQVPAQFTDIVTALASGQQPLTVFLQQGGQLKDAFGGAGNAARALGGYVLGLVNPFTLAAAAAAALGAAYIAGEKEAQGYARAVILTGNAAGITAVELQRLAAAQDNLAGTQGKAAEVLTALVSTGKVAREVLAGAADAAIRLERAGGPAAEETISKLGELGKEPLQALLRLNEAEGFLTASLYKRVKALNDSGQATDAARAAQEGYLAAIGGRSDELEGSLTKIQRGWRGVKDFAKEAWDAMLSVNRPGDPLQKAREAVEVARQAAQSIYRNDADKERLKSAEAYLAKLEEQERSRQKEAAELAKALATERERVKLAETNSQWLGKARREAAELAAAQAEGQRRIAAGLITQRDLEEKLADIRATYADKGAAKDVAAQRERDNAALEKALGLTGTYAKDLAELDSQRKRNVLTEQQYVKAVEELIQAQPFAVKLAKQQADAEKQVADAMERGNDLYLKKIEALQQSASAAAAQVQKLQDEEAALAISAASNVSLAQAIELVTIKRLEEKKAAAIGNDAEVAAIQREIDKRRELAQLIGNKEARDAAKKSADEAAREWKRASDDIERSLTDALIRGFDSGKGLIRSLRDYLVNAFKTAVVKFAVQAVMPSGGFGALFGGAASTGIGGGLGSLGGVNTVLDKLGLGSLASTLNTVAGPLASIYNISKGNYGAGIGAGIGSVLGGLPGLAIGNFIGSALDKAFGGAGTHHSGAGFVSDGTTGTSVKDAAYGLGGAYGDSVHKYFNAGIEDALKTITGRAAAVLNGFSAAFGGAGGYQVGGYFASDNNRGSNFGRSVLLNGSVISEAHGNNLNKDPSLGLQELADDIAGQVRSVMQQIDLPEWARTQLSALGSDVTFDQLTQAVASITATITALEQLGAVMPQLSNLTGAAVDGLLTAMGGVENLTNAAGAYYQNFYSDAERTAAATAQLSQQLQALGLSVPASREAYRALVEAQDLNTESGRKAYAELLKLSPAFAALVPVTEELGQVADGSAAEMQRAAEQMAEAGRRVLADLAQQQGDLQVELLRAQGEVQAAAELERARAIARITEGLSAQDATAATAAYDFNAALREQINALNAAKSAAEQAAEAEAQRVAAIASERAGLEQRLLQQQGDTAGLRALELQTLDASNRAILERIFLLQDQQDAEQEAARLAQQAIQAAQDTARAEEQRQAAIAQQRSGLEERLLQLQGNTGELRARELLALDASLRPMLERIYALQDEQSAATAAAQAARDLEAAQQAAAQAEAQRVQAIANERDGLITRLLQAEGNTAELRARELAGLDASNRSILERIFAIEDEKIAQQAAAQAAEEAARAAQQAADEQARAAEQLRSAWQSVTDTIFDEVKRIRGLIGGNSAQSLAAAQRDFAITTAQARAGDQEAAKLLPGLSKTLLDLAEASATSLLDVERIRAQVAASLERTGTGLVSSFGLALPKLATGTNNVPRDMVAMLHKGEAVVPRQYNPAAGGAASDGRLLASLDALRDENKAQALSIVKLQTEISRLLKKWDGEGLPEERSVAA